ncbi:hypothetical protein TKK_0003681 [Trichogramma kaykai]
MGDYAVNGGAAGGDPNGANNAAPNNPPAGNNANAGNNGNAADNGGPNELAAVFSGERLSSIPLSVAMMRCGTPNRVSLFLCGAR